MRRLLAILLLLMIPQLRSFAITVAPEPSPDPSAIDINGLLAARNFDAFSFFTRAYGNAYFYFGVFCSNTTFTSSSIVCTESNTVEAGPGGSLAFTSASNSGDLWLWVCELTGVGTPAGPVQINLGGTNHTATALGSAVSWGNASNNAFTDEFYKYKDTGGGASPSINCGSNVGNIFGWHFHETGKTLDVDQHLGLTTVNSAAASQSHSVITTAAHEVNFGYVNWNNSAACGTGYTCLDTFPVSEGEGQASAGTIASLWTVGVGDNIVVDDISITDGGGGGSPSGFSKRQKLCKLDQAIC